MITLELDPQEIAAACSLLRFHLATWGLDPDQDFTLAIQGDEAKVTGEDGEGKKLDFGVDYLNYSFDDAAFEDAWEKGRARGFEEKAQVARIEALLHGDAASGRSLAELLPDIEHLVKRATEAQDRVVELERGEK